MSKVNTKETTNNNKVNDTKTVQNIKYEPILSNLVLWFHLQGLIIRKFEFEKWVKFYYCGQNLIL